MAQTYAVLSAKYIIMFEDDAIALFENLDEAQQAYAEINDGNYQLHEIVPQEFAVRSIEKYNIGAK